MSGSIELSGEDYHRLLAEAQESRELRAERDRLAAKCATSLANNLCSDHFDKQAGKPCLACTIDRLAAELAETQQLIATLQAALRASEREIAALRDALRDANASPPSSGSTGLEVDRE